MNKQTEAKPAKKDQAGSIGKALGQLAGLLAPQQSRMELVPIPVRTDE